MNSSVARWLAGFLGALSLTGCQESEGIREYTAKKDSSFKAASAKPAGPVRTLAAIIPKGDSTWFVKLMGPAAQLENQAGNFGKWVESFRFEGGNNPVFDVPPGWTKGQGNKDRFASLKLPEENGGHEATVISLSGSGGSTLANINRWRDQLGLSPIEEKDLASNTQEKVVAGQKVILFDATGPGKVGGTRMPPFASSKNAPPVENRPGPEKSAESKMAMTGLEVKIPTGWKEVAPKPLSVKTYQAGPAEVTIIPLPENAGGPVANINRWRTQVELSELPPDKVLSEAQTIATVSGNALVVDLGGQGKEPKRIIAAILPRAKMTWFVKMTGPSEGTAKEKDRFLALIRELKLPE